MEVWGKIPGYKYGLTNNKWNAVNTDGHAELQPGNSYYLYHR